MTLVSGTEARPINILGIESSCDDTGAAVCRNGEVISNIVTNQTVHEIYGGVVPELASRAHQQHIIPAVDRALEAAGLTKQDLSAIAFTQGPGLMGSLLVGCSFSKALALGLGLPLIGVDHLQGHVLSAFISGKSPSFPFLCLLVSGGHTQIIEVASHFSMKLIGTTTDDAAGEAFDKSAKILGFPYPGGVEIDRHAALGDPFAFAFPEPRVAGLDFSFSGLKTSFMYLVRDRLSREPNFIDLRRNDLAASIQHAIVKALVSKLKLAAKKTGITQIAIAGGVSANKGLRRALTTTAAAENWELFIPDLAYCTDNAAMIAQVGYFRYSAELFTSQDAVSYARLG